MRESGFAQDSGVAEERRVEVVEADEGEDPGHHPGHRADHAREDDAVRPRVGLRADEAHLKTWGLREPTQTPCDFRSASPRHGPSSPRPPCLEGGARHVEVRPRERQLALHRPPEAPREEREEEADDAEDDAAHDEAEHGADHVEADPHLRVGRVEPNGKKYLSYHIL